MSRTRALCAILILAMSAVGCAATSPLTNLLRGQLAIRSGIVRTSSLEAQPRAEDCYLDLVFDRNPTRPYVVIGRVTASWVGTDQRALDALDEQVLAPLRVEACRAGGHALFLFESSFDDQWITHSGSSGETHHRGGYSRSIYAHALVAVYVRRDGSLMPAPTSAQRIIRIPSALPNEEEGRTEDGIHPAWERGITDPWAVPAD